MPSDKPRIDVMVSSTTRDLGDHRRRVGEVVSRFQFVPRIMDLDSTTGKDGVTYSLDLVDEAEVYILLLGFRYGYVPDDPRNPRRISITQMEYERALEREARGELCVLPFVMADDHPVLHDHIETDPENRRKLAEFRAAVLLKQVAFFNSIDALEKGVLQALSQSPCVKALTGRGGDSRAFEPREAVGPVLPPPSPNPRMRDHIFISYAHLNRSLVDLLADDLRRRGHIVWIDFEGIRGGDVWRQSIVDGIAASEVVLVVITPDSLKSEWVALEARTALEFGKQIIPLLLEKLTQPEDRKAYAALHLEAIQYRDFTVGYETALPALIADLPKPRAGLAGYCQRLVARLAQAPWGLDHYIEGEARLLPLYASPYEEGAHRATGENLLRKLWHNRRTIVLGEPGMGKSVALERFAWELANNNPPIIPVLIMLREYDSRPLVEWVRLKLLEFADESLRLSLNSTESVQNLLAGSPYRFYILLDGLNEVPLPHRGSIVGEIIRFSLEYSNFPLALTSRVHDENWRSLREGSFDPETVVIQPITEGQAQTYLAAHLERGDARVLWRRLDERMRGLAATPLLLWLIKEAWVESRERIPGNRGELYANFINRMLRRDDDRRMQRGITRDVLLSAAEMLALEMHRQKVVSLPLNHAQTILPDAHLLDALRSAGLLQGDEQIRFAPHQTVQEHFAARALGNAVATALRERKGVLGQMAYRLGLRRDALEFAREPWWWETFIQLAGLVPEASGLVLALADINPWLALFCYEESGIQDRDVRNAIGNRSEALVYAENTSDRRAALNALLRIQTLRITKYLLHLSFDRDVDIASSALRGLLELEENGLELFWRQLETLRPEERADWGRRIHKQDPRPGVGLRSDGLPDIDWVDIPDDGEWTYQAGTHRGVPAFRISRYPVTYAQFQAFVEAEDGFSNPRWWDELGADDEHKREPGEQRFKFLNHPRNNVSWYDAVAFCRWLNDKLGYEVRLPTEQEWEKAARGTDGRIYPYCRNMVNALNDRLVLCFSRHGDMQRFQADSALWRRLRRGQRQHA